MTFSSTTPKRRAVTPYRLERLTALVVMSLIEVGMLGLGTAARSVLGDDLPLIADDVSVSALATASRLRTRSRFAARQGHRDNRSSVPFPGRCD